ncbi:MAG: hypothetical protein HY238_07310 [Acidobacteria bacterium]|nr:hypothetical protein [Acidobacteriota bacterium]
MLYCGLLPLWEGFDEPFHYGYVQTLSRQRTLPRLHETTLSEEVWTSLHLAPASHVVAQNIPGLMTFREYFALQPAERAALRRRLNTIPPSALPSGALNYEAQQAPLAYALLAFPDWLWREVPLPRRIWRLRLVCSVASCVLMAFATGSLGRRLRLPAPEVLLFLVFSTQMFYASTAHICNDWLAIPLAVALLRAAVEPRLGPLCLLLSAGLLTKAYFLAFVPFALALALWWSGWRAAGLFSVGLLAFAGPWYGRNLLLYGSLSARQEAVGGAGVGQVLSSLVGVNWLAAVPSLARSGLWTGNNSFTTFSQATLNLVLLLFLVAAVLYLVRRPWPREEWIVAAGCACYGLAFWYAIGQSFVFTGSTAAGPHAWLTQPLLAPGLCLLLCGLARSGRLGRIVTTALVALGAYMISATYVWKLVPLYGGWQGRPRWPVRDILNTTCLLPATAVYLQTALVLAAAIFLAAGIVRRIQKAGGTFPASYRKE